MRSPSHVTNAAFWAEDGTVFFKDAVERGFGALFMPYAGQEVVVQRAIAATIAPFPISLQPSLYAIAAIAIAVLACGIVLSSRWRGRIPLEVRFGCLLLLVCAPGLDDTYVTLVNAHWWLAIGLVLIGMLDDPVSRRMRSGELVVAVVTALSGFAAVYAIPMLVVRALRNRSAHSRLLAGVAVLGVVWQATLLVGSDRRGSVATMIADPAALVGILVKRVLVTSAIGEANLEAVFPLATPTLVAWMIAGACAIVFAVVWLRPFRLEVGALLLSMVGGVLLAAYALTQPGYGVFMLFWPTGGARYFLVPRAALAMSLVGFRPTGLICRASLGLAAVVLAGGALSDYHVAPTPPNDWNAFATCMELPHVSCSTTIAPGWPLEMTSRGP